MRRTLHRALRAGVPTGALALLMAFGGVLAPPAAAAAPADCTAGLAGSTSAYAECPAGAGDFEFRVVAQSGGIAGLATVYGDWRRPSADAPVRSSVSCQYAPKCAAFSPTIEFR